MKEKRAAVADKPTMSIVYKPGDENFAIMFAKLKIKESKTPALSDIHCDTTQDDFFYYGLITPKPLFNQPTSGKEFHEMLTKKFLPYVQIINNGVFHSLMADPKSVESVKQYASRDPYIHREMAKCLERHYCGKYDSSSTSYKVGLNSGLKEVNAWSRMDPVPEAYWNIVKNASALNVIKRNDPTDEDVRSDRSRVKAWMGDVDVMYDHLGENKAKDENKRLAYKSQRPTKAAENLGSQGSVDSPITDEMGRKVIKTPNVQVSRESSKAPTMMLPENILISHLDPKYSTDILTQNVPLPGFDDMAMVSEVQDEMPSSVEAREQCGPGIDSVHSAETGEEHEIPDMEEYETHFDHSPTAHSIVCLQHR